MPDKQKSIDYKNTAVEYFLVEDTTQEEVCRIFKCSRRSLIRWVKQYTTDGEITGYERKPIATDCVMLTRNERHILFSRKTPISENACRSRYVKNMPNLIKLD